MKHSLLIPLFLVFIAFIVQDCATKDYPYPEGRQKNAELLNSLLTKGVQNGNTPTIEVKRAIISKEDLDDILSRNLGGTAIKDIMHYSSKTISEDGLLLLHSISFEEGGWALVAGRELSQNQIIAYGEEGSFDPENIESPEVQFWFNMTKSSLKHAFERADREEESPMETAYINPESRISTNSFSYDDPYVWARLYLGFEHSTTITNVDHLTETEWGQSYPWNYKCPSLNGEKCPLGCVAVAVGQLLYYLHFHIGIPSGCFHTIDTSYTWNSGGNYFTSTLTRNNYNAPSPRWNSMAKTYSSGFNYGHMYAGDLLIDVADRLSTYFSYPFSAASFYAINNTLSYYNINCSEAQQYNYSQTLSQLNSSLPVIVRGKDSSTGDGHVWLIDGYQRHHYLQDYQYKWVIMPPDSLQYYNNINYDYVLTEAQMQQFYPDIVENQIVHEYSASDDYYFRMNWGWGGLDNDGTYSILPSDWISGTYQFSLNTLMITGFTN